MTKDSEEHKQYKSEYEAKEKERKDNPNKYPWFAYYQYGFHHMTYLSDKEVEENVKFYHLSKIGENWVRYGRQPITIMPRK